MKIVSFTMVNNAAEIIESFIRYNANFVDEMIVIDNGCTDNTVIILRKLIEEGYRIHIYDESLEAFNAFKFENKYIQLILQNYNADIAIPLDVDEFIIADENPRKALEKLDLNAIYYVNWQWYVLTKNDIATEQFIPKRLRYCLNRAPWNYSDGTPVTKIIIPTNYYQKHNLTIAMGHHTVYGNNDFEIRRITNIKIAHYRLISENQLVNKTLCYTIRDIATLDNNYETAQRTNQMALISQGRDMSDISIEASYGGYSTGIEFKPISLSGCNSNTTQMRYSNLATLHRDELEYRIGCEMAIKYYNCERKKRERAFLKPIIFWMDGIKGDECIFPDPSNKLTMLTMASNTRAYITTEQRIKFLKANFRLIVTPEWAKFIPHTYIVIPETANFEECKEKLIQSGIDDSQIISWNEYKKKLHIVGVIWLYLGVIPGSLQRINAYIKRNGLKNTTNKIRERLKK